MHSSDLLDLAADFDVIKRFNHYFQESHTDGRPDPDVEFVDEWLYFVVDFQGWSRRQIPLRVAQHYYLLFTSTVGHKDNVTVILFRRWEPLDNFALDQPLPTGTLGELELNSVVHETSEIRELHKFHHTPVGGSNFDLEGCPLGADPLSRSAHISSLSRGSSRYPANSSSRRWLRQMAANQPPSASSSSSSNGNRGIRSSCPVSRLVSGIPSRNRSALPCRWTYHHRCEDSPPDVSMLKQRAVAKLCECCASIVHADAVWTMPSGLTWDATFLDESFLLFSDTRTLTRM